MKQALTALVVALALAGAAAAAREELAPVTATGYSTLIASYSIKPVTFAPVAQTSTVRLTTIHPARYTITVKRRGALWWKATGATEGYVRSTIGWAGRSSTGKGVARPGVYDVRLVVVDTGSPDEAHTFRSNWQVQVLAR